MNLNDLDKKLNDISRDADKAASSVSRLTNEMSRLEQVRFRAAQQLVRSKASGASQEEVDFLSAQLTAGNAAGRVSIGGKRFRTANIANQIDRDIDVAFETSYQELKKALTASSASKHSKAINAFNEVLQIADRTLVARLQNIGTEIDRELAARTAITPATGAVSMRGVKQGKIYANSIPGQRDAVNNLIQSDLENISNQRMGAVNNATTGFEQQYLRLQQEALSATKQAIAEKRRQAELLNQENRLIASEVWEVNQGRNANPLRMMGAGKAGGAFQEMGNKIYQKKMEEALVDNLTKSQQKYTEESVLQGLGNIRGEKALGLAKTQGYNVEDLKKVVTQQPAGVSTLSFQKNIDGVIQKTEITVDRFGQTLFKTNRRLLGFVDAVIENTKELIRWSVGVTLVYGGIRKLDELVKTAIENQTKLADVTVALGSAQRSVNAIFEDAGKIAEKTGENISGVLEAYVMAYRAVGAIKDPIERTTAANKLLYDATVLNKLSSLDAAESIDVLSGSLRQLQQPNESAQKAFDRGTELLDKWVQVTKIANVDMATLATAFSITSESAENAGVSIDQLNGIIGSLSEKIGGLGGKETGNAVRALIGGMYQEQGAKELAKYGIAVSDTAGKMRPFLEISKEIYALYSKGMISSDQLNKIGYALGGGVRRGQQYIAFLSDLQRIQQIVEEQANSGGSAQEALSKKLDTVATATTRLGNAFQQLAQTLGNNGGLLDIMTGLTNFTTKLVEGFNLLATVLGKISVPVALVGALALFAKIKPEQYSAFMSGMAGSIQGWGNKNPNSMNNRLNMALSGQSGTGTIPWIGVGGANTLAKMGMSTLIGSYPAMSRLGAGDTRGAAIDFGGAVAGALISKGNPIGGVIGSAIAEIFVSKVLNYKPTIAEAFQDLGEGKPYGTYKKGASGDWAADNATNQVLADVGHGSVTRGKVIGAISQFLLGSQVITSNLLGGTNFNQPSQLQAAMGSKTLLDTMTGGIFKRIFGEENMPGEVSASTSAALKAARVKDATTETIDLKTSSVFQEQQALFDKNKADLEALKQSTQDDLRQKLFSGDIKPTDYLTGLKQTEGFFSSLTEYYTAFGTEFDKIRGDVNGTSDAFKKFSEIIVNGSTENIQYLNQGAEEILKLTELIRNAEKEGAAGINVGTQEAPNVVSIAEAKTLLANKQTNMANAASAMATGITKEKVNVPDLSNIQTTAAGKILLENKARAMQDLFAKSLTPDEREKYEAEMKLAKVMVEIWENGKLKFYEASTGLDPKFLNQAFDEATKSGDIQKVNSEGLGFQTFDMQSSKFWDIINQGYAPLLKALEAQGYKEQPEDLIPVFQDGVQKPMHLDMKIVQYLLQEILDTEKKQLEGVYNLPEGASFMVPYQAARMYPQGGGGGGDLASLLAMLKDALGNKPYEMSENDLRQMQYMKQAPVSSGYSNSATTADGFKPWKNESTGNVFRTPQNSSYWDSGIKGAGKNGTFDRSNTSTDTSAGLLGYMLSYYKSQGMLNYDLLKSAPKSLPQDTSKSAPKSNVNFKLQLQSSTQLIVDGRILANIIKPYLRDDLLTSEGKNGTVSASVIV